MLDREYKVFKPEAGGRELHVYFEGETEPLIRAYMGDEQPEFTVQRGISLPWLEFRERTDRFFQKREWETEPEERSRRPELLAIRALLTSFQRGEIIGPDLTRAYFTVNRALQTECQQWPPELRQILDHLFVELDQTIWPTESYMKGESDEVWYNGPDSIAPIIADTLSAIDVYL